MSWHDRKNTRWHQVSELLMETWGAEEPIRGVEIGVKEARFSTYLLSRFPNLMMAGVDPMQRREPLGFGGETYDWDWDAIWRERRDNLAPYSDRFVELLSESSVACGAFKDDSVHFVFIDGEHTYEAVTEDIACWTRKVMPGGLIIGHDYCEKFPGVVVAVDRFFPDVSRGLDNTWWHSRV